MSKRLNADGLNARKPGVLSVNISLQVNIVISGNGLIDTSKKEGFHGLCYSQLASDV
jgi:hypothetical protein